MEPEIAHRCKSCGAAIRSRSTFCPQCGVALDADAPTAAAAAVATPEHQEEQGIDRRPSPDPLAATMAPNLEMPAQPDATIRPQAVAPPDAPPPPAPEDVRPRSTAATTAAATTADTPVENGPRANVGAPIAAPADGPGGKRQRVSPVTGRDILDERVRPRAEKLRRASSVVLDEAATDPSLRFVLVAVGLVIISILLLLLARIL
ncbi:MAG TPA: hypothetical protein VGC64_07920 [Pyrinomonadaceae bacterium]